MKSLIALALPLCTTILLPAQVASTECLDEAQRVYAFLDHQRHLAGTSYIQFSYKHSYESALQNEDHKIVTLDEQRTLGPNFFLLECPDYITGSDASEGFDFRKLQYAVYRTRPNLKAAALLPGVDKGVFAFCLVKECSYIPVNDTLRHKRAYIVVNEEGQKRYKIKDIELIWNPLNARPVAVRVAFISAQPLLWTKLEFTQITEITPPAASDVKTYLFETEGNLHKRFQGAEILDYR